MHPSIQSFKQTKVLVVGDIMLDTYYWGQINRMSPEAPVPIVAVDKIERRLGGAGNVVANLQSLQAIPFMASVVGDDSTADHMMQILAAENISSQYILRAKNRVSTEKIRIINHTEHVVRCDLEQCSDIDTAQENALLALIEKAIATEKIEVIILQDYNKGVLSETLINKVIQIAEAHQIPITVDPKKKNFFAYKKVDLFKPNLKEVKEALNISIDPNMLSDLQKAGQMLLDKLACKHVFITLSEHGAFYMSADGNANKIPAHPRNIVDVSGAGDTVISAASLCIAKKCSIDQTVFIANLAGGLVCEEAGVAKLSLDALTLALQATEADA